PRLRLLPDLRAHRLAFPGHRPARDQQLRGLRGTGARRLGDLRGGGPADAARARAGAARAPALGPRARLTSAERLAVEGSRYSAGAMKRRPLLVLVVMAAAAVAHAAAHAQVPGQPAPTPTPPAPAPPPAAGGK